VQLALVMAGPGVLAGLTALVLVGVTQSVGFGVEHLVEGSLDTVADHLGQVPLNGRLIKLDDFL
jgi:hypothetical protein